MDENLSGPSQQCARFMYSSRRTDGVDGVCRLTMVSLWLLAAYLGGCVKIPKCMCTMGASCTNKAVTLRDIGKQLSVSNRYR